jgi:hypothetical protein
MVLLRHCGKRDWCYPSQGLLAEEMGFKETRSVRKYLRELEMAGIVLPKRKGFNRPNTYFVSKYLKIEEERYPDTSQIGSTIPLHRGARIPPKSKYIKGKDKRKSKEYKKLREMRNGLVRKKSI